MAGDQPDLALVELLADGGFHSGEQLGKRLSLSRAAVWKRLQRLADFGLNIERVRGKGYRLPGGLELLEVPRIRAAGRNADCELLLLPSVESTNTHALMLGRQGKQTPFAVLAEQQTGGRGRRGRQWVSPLGSNIYLSFAANFEAGAARLEGLSLAVGVVVAEVLNGHGLGGRIGLKWPNDIQVDGRKLAGILIELSGDLDAGCVTVIGIGINGALSREQSRAIDQPWTDVVTETGQALARNRLVGELLEALPVMLDDFQRLGFAPFRERWEALDVCRGKRVGVVLVDRTVQGVAVGVTDKGALRIATDQGEQVFHGGEVSLRIQ